MRFEKNWIQCHNIKIESLHIRYEINNINFPNNKHVTYSNTCYAISPDLHNNLKNKSCGLRSEFLLSHIELLLSQLCWWQHMRKHVVKIWNTLNGPKSIFFLLKLYNAPWKTTIFKQKLKERPNWKLE
jgi:hypothetical protein